MKNSIVETRAKNMNWNWFWDWFKGFDALDWFNKVATNLAIIAAAYVAYLKYIKGRLYKARLQPTLSCALSQDEDTDRLLISAQIINTGMISIPIPSGGFSLRLLFPAPIQSQFIQEVGWREEDVFYLFSGQKDIEAGESANDELLLSIPKERPSSLKLHLRVFYNGNEWAKSKLMAKLRKLIPLDGGGLWDAVAVVSLGELTNTEIQPKAAISKEGESWHTKAMEPEKAQHSMVTQTETQTAPKKKD